MEPVNVHWYPNPVREEEKEEEFCSFTLSTAPPLPSSGHSLHLGLFQRPTLPATCLLVPVAAAEVRFAHNNQLTAHIFGSKGVPEEQWSSFLVVLPVSPTGQSSQMEEAGHIHSIKLLVHSLLREGAEEEVVVA